MVKINYYYI